TGVGEINTDMRFDVYPNPNNGNLNVDVALPGIQDIAIEIYNELGQRLLTKSESRFYSGTLQFNLSTYAPGLYFVKLTGKDHSVARKIILQK
ncbi:MAG TPA: T9SS type A sorting domain-containing protein, partial [Chitinophagales bacterium]|nr:T9SS type A sorting domain-containing protein [Chitinophagales bacterium]